MTDTTVEYEQIGTIRSPFDSPAGMPIQPAGATATKGTLEIAAPYTDGLRDLDGFSHCILLYHFHATDDDASMQVEPFLDESERGIFATRAPTRPNPVGLSVVEIGSVTESTVTVRGIDVVDGTPLLDIKPFVPGFDVPDDVETGWLTASNEMIQSEHADERFL